MDRFERLRAESDRLEDLGVRKLADHDYAVNKLGASFALEATEKALICRL